MADESNINERMEATIDPAPRTMADALLELRAHGGRKKVNGGTYCRICYQADPCDVQMVVNAFLEIQKTLAATHVVWDGDTSTTYTAHELAQMIENQLLFPLEDTSPASDAAPAADGPQSPEKG